VNNNIRIGYAGDLGIFYWLRLILAASLLWLSATARASATTSTVNANGGQVFDVKTYGAVGDGSTDDTAAIQSAITAASATGGTVFFPPGVFVLPSLLTCKSLNNVSFQGSGKSTTILKSAIPVNFPPRGGGPTMLGFWNCANFSIRDITFDNNNIITALRSCMVSVSGSTNFRFSNCAFINAKHFILSIQSSSRFWVKDNYFNCTERNSKVFTGAIMLFDNISKTSDGQIVNNEIIGAGSGGRGVDIVWDHNRITNFGFGAGIYSGHDGVGFGTHNWTITGNSITGGQPARDGCGFYPKGIEVYAPRTKIIGNTVYNNSGTGIVFGGRDSIVANNSCFPILIRQIALLKATPVEMLKGGLSITDFPTPGATPQDSRKRNWPALKAQSASLPRDCISPAMISRETC
jgi:parallel beta-helix repeat protein